MRVRIAGFILLLVLAGEAFAGTTELEARAPRLHDLYCKFCHSASDYLLDTRNINSQEQLRSHVAGYRGKQAPVSEDEIRAIADYLWEFYYSEPLED
ncbi:MAG: hypothetical protein OQL28_11925 [Sedimenticola sp.]|nr:hypothetical protein [Sedimenticola sp.]